MPTRSKRPRKAKRQKKDKTYEVTYLQNDGKPHGSGHAIFPKEIITAPDDLAVYQKALVYVQKEKLRGYRGDIRVNQIREIVREPVYRDINLETLKSKASS